jgi:hypothetical protein
MGSKDVQTIPFRGVLTVALRCGPPPAVGLQHGGRVGKPCGRGSAARPPVAPTKRTPQAGTRTRTAPAQGTATSPSCKASQALGQVSRTAGRSSGLMAL